MKIYSLFLYSIMFTFIIIAIIPKNGISECETPGYIKFIEDSAVFTKDHRPPGTCSEIYQNGMYTAQARYGTSLQPGTSPGKYERCISADGVEWERKLEKYFELKSPQTKVTWDGDNETSWNIQYQFSDYPSHSVAYQAQFTTSTPQLEDRTLVGSHISTDVDSAVAADVVAWQVSTPNPDLPDGEYRAWKVGEIYNLYLKTDGVWLPQRILPVP